jgi:hypothetical protein
VIKARKGRLRFVTAWQAAIAYKTQDMNWEHRLYVPAKTAVIVLGPHAKAKDMKGIYVEVLSCLGVVWIEMKNLSNGPDPE